jgi:anti-sigma regulatory factor (Ser/Thr protein kinase)
MEVTPLTWVHQVFPMDDVTRVGEARRHAAGLAAELGFNELDAGRLALVVTELGTNLQRHAQKGRLLIAARAAMGDVEVLAIDEGPGIADPQQSLKDGFSTSSTPGTGLGAVKRLADDFDLHSAVPDGTVCVARVRSDTAVPPPEAAVELAAICLPAPNETVSGDGWSAALEATRSAIVLADGLGHGPDAAEASNASLKVFANDAFVDLTRGVRETHQALQTTRGAALILARVEADAVVYAGAGNIVGRVVSGVFDKTLITQHGTVGLTIRAPEVTRQEMPPHALLVLHSDGIDTRWKPERILPVMRSDLSLVAAVLLRDHTRQRDDATVIVLRRRP